MHTNVILELAICHMWNVQQLELSHVTLALPHLLLYLVRLLGQVEENEGFGQTRVPFVLRGVM